MNNTVHGKNALMQEIMELAFSKTEAELFLDTHPDSAQALSYYKETVARLEKLIEEYTDRFGPITQGAVKGETWSWLDGPWPWQRAGDENRKGGL